MIPIPFDYTDDGRIVVSDDDREMAKARSVILKRLCVENGINANEAMLAVAVFIGDLLKHQSDSDARRAASGLFKLVNETYVINTKGNGQ